MFDYLPNESRQSFNSFPLLLQDGDGYTFKFIRWRSDGMSRLYSFFFQFAERIEKRWVYLCHYLSIITFVRRIYLLEKYNIIVQFNSCRIWIIFIRILLIMVWNYSAVLFHAFVCLLFLNFLNAGEFFVIYLHCHLLSRISCIN